MAKRKSKSKKKRVRRRFTIVFIVLLFLLFGGFIYLSQNFNLIITDKIHGLYNQSKVSSYYHLKFDKLRVNLFNMSVRIYNVHFSPKTDEFGQFFQENGSLDVQIGKVVINEAGLLAFIVDNSLSVKNFTVEHSIVHIDKPNDVFNPFSFVNDTANHDSLHLKVDIQMVKLKDTQLDYKGDNEQNVYNRFRTFGLNIEDIHFNTSSGIFDFSLKKLEAFLSDAEINDNDKGHFSLEHLQFGISQFSVENKSNKFNLNYSNFYIQLIKPSFCTADSLYTVSMDSLRIDKLKQQIKINKAKFQPNLSKSQFGQRNRYQTLYADMTIDQVLVAGFDYDQLINHKSLIADTIYVSRVYADLYKDKNKPIDKSHIPNYLAGQIYSINVPLNIKAVVAEDVHVDFSVRQPDGRLSKVNVNGINGILSNVQNMEQNEKLHLTAKGKVANSIPFYTSLEFFYGKEMFNFSGRIYKSDLTTLSNVVRSFAPVAINKGVLNSIDFKGHVSLTHSRGTMEFLYNDIGLEIESGDHKKKKGFQNYMVSIAANTLIYSNNPVDINHPKRQVDYFVQRDMNKGFINILVMSLLGGIKETVMPSKENRKKYKTEKSKRKQKSSNG